jgi:hypothetical protein
MIASLPTADEIATVVGSGLGESELEKPEQWVLSCARLPQLHTRLDCWAFKLQVCAEREKESGHNGFLIEEILILGLLIY